MKFSILTALAAVLGRAAAANQAVVINDCSTAIYVQSYPYNGGAPGPLTTVKPGQRFSEDMRTSGSVGGFLSSAALRSYSILASDRD